MYFIDCVYVDGFCLRDFADSYADAVAICEEVKSEGGCATIGYRG